ncbi:MAG: DUF370 domain-containing protein [Clostridia bacterium]|nr:DUF370 domain-containing protein [Clostridia bacterium]
MFVNLENDISIKKKEIIGIFNMDTATDSPVTKDFLKVAEKEMKIIYAGKRMPESFVVADDGISESVYISSFLADTLVNRTEK